MRQEKTSVFILSVGFWLAVTLFEPYISEFLLLLPEVVLAILALAFIPLGFVVLMQPYQFISEYCTTWGMESTRADNLALYIWLGFLAVLFFAKFLIH